MAYIMETNVQKKQLPLVERHRPQTLGDIVGQDEVVKVLRGFVKRKNMPNLMLSGDSGVGKTSAAFAFIKDFYAEFGISRWQPMVLSINASQENGIATIREQIVPFATTGYNSMPDILEQLRDKNCVADRHFVVPKIIVLDEADAMTKVAQWALGPIIDKTSDNARYIFIVNYQRKMQDDLQSRCEVLRFPPLSRLSVNCLITKVCEKENIAFEPPAAAAIGIVAQSDMRMALNILSSCVLQKKKHDKTPLTEAFVYTAAGRVEPSATVELLKWFFAKSTLQQTCKRLEEHIENNNLSLSQVLIDLHEICLCVAAQNAELDFHRQIEEDTLHRLFKNEQFAKEFFELLDETEQHLLAITDIARMQVQTRAFAARVWKTVTTYNK